MDNPVALILPVAAAIQLVMHRCNVVISGSWKARNNNIDGFMRHGRPNDNHLPSNYIALQGQQLCVGSFGKQQQKKKDDTLQSHKNSAVKSTNTNAIRTRTASCWCHQLIKAVKRYCLRKREEWINETSAAFFYAKKHLRLWQCFACFELTVSYNEQGQLVCMHLSSMWDRDES